MRIVSGGKHSNEYWVVVNDDDTEVLFNPNLELDVAKNLKLCNLWVNSPEYRDLLTAKFEGAK